MSGHPRNADSHKDATEAVGRVVWTSSIGAAKPLNAAYPRCAEIRLSRVQPWLLSGIHHHLHSLGFGAMVPAGLG